MSPAQQTQCTLEITGNKGCRGEGLMELRSYRHSSNARASRNISVPDASNQTGKDVELEVSYNSDGNVLWLLWTPGGGPRNGPDAF
jgi:hypothetical protein